MNRSELRTTRKSEAPIDLDEESEAEVHLAPPKWNKQTLYVSSQGLRPQGYMLSVA